jgi:Protein of unknown function (DUF4054)
MAITPAQFIIDFPAFSNSTTYEPGNVQFWLSLGYQMVNARRWGVLTDFGAELFTAHNLILEQQSAAAAATGGVPGLETGAVSAKSVGPLSKSYDTSTGIDANAGHWRLTTYGQRFLWLQNIIGMSGAYIRPRGGDFGPFPSGPAYAGPFIDNGNA